jgi:signal transduction histidine kinase
MREQPLPPTDLLTVEDDQMTALSLKEPVRIEAPPADGAMHIDDLRELMRSVNETTERLHATHAALREQVSRLQGELAEANAQLRRSRSLAALGEMAAGIAHEVRNPLGSIQLYVQLLGEDLADCPQQAELCGKIDRAVAGLDAIVRDVLQFARDMKISPSEATPDDLFDRALAACEALVAGSGVTIVREIESGVGLTADVGLLTQSLANVIRNAIEAMGLRDERSRTLRLAAGRRSVRCPDGRTRQCLVFTIDDTGGGIPHDVLDRIFNPFFTTRKTGTGLGLAIVHRIVDAHGGHINVRNRPEGGTRFELCLPEGSRPSAVSRREAVNGRKPKADRHKPLQEAT